MSLYRGQLCTLRAMCLLVCWCARTTYFLLFVYIFRFNYYFLFCSFLCVLCILSRNFMVCFLFSYYFGHFDSFMFVIDGIQCRILICVHWTVSHFSHSVFFLFIVGLIFENENYSKSEWKSDVSENLRLSFYRR